MRLCSYTEDGTEHLGWVEGGRVAPVAGAAGDHLPATMADLVAGGAAALASLRSIQSKLAGKSGVNAETSAHTRNVLFTIEKALKTD